MGCSIFDQLDIFSSISHVFLRLLQLSNLNLYWLHHLECQLRSVAFYIQDLHSFPACLTIVTETHGRSASELVVEEQVFTLSS